MTFLLMAAIAYLPVTYYLGYRWGRVAGRLEGAARSRALLDEAVGEWKSAAHDGREVTLTLGLLWRLAEKEAPHVIAGHPELRARLKAIACDDAPPS